MRRAPPKGKRFEKGKSGNPGGVSKEKRAFLERLKIEDAEAIYDAFMAGVKRGDAPFVLRAVEYLAGKPPAAPEDNDALKQGMTVVVQRLADPKESP